MYISVIINIIPPEVKETCRSIDIHKLPLAMVYTTDLITLTILPIVSMATWYIFSHACTVL